MDKFLRVAEAARLAKVSPSTMRKYADAGKVKSSRSVAGQRVFLRGDVEKFMGVERDGKVVFYVRSSKGDRSAMDAQVTELTESFGEPYKVYRDAGSGLNEKRQGLQALLTAVRKGGFERVAVTFEDRLARFGVTYLRELFAQNGVELVVLHEKKTAPGEELMEDFMALLASFSGRFYRMRSRPNQKKFLNEVAEKLED